MSDKRKPDWKLIRILNGVYRNDKGTIRLYYQPFNNEESPWLMRRTDKIGCTDQRFRTLADARRFLKYS